MLLDGECIPTTSEIGFIELPVAETAAAFRKRMRVVPMRETHHTGPQKDVLNELLPLTSVESVRRVFVQTASRWTAYFDSGWRGTDCSTTVANLAENRCMGMRAATDEFGNIWTVYGSNGVDVRHISATEEAPGEWEFRQEGEPFPFEEVARYKKRRIRDRFPVELLVEYLKPFEIDLFNADFYRGPAILFERKLHRHLSAIPSRLPRIDEYATFAAARENRPSRTLFYFSHYRSRREMDEAIQKMNADMIAHMSGRDPDTGPSS